MKKIILVLSLCLFSSSAICQDIENAVAPVSPTLNQRLHKMQKRHDSDYAETVAIIKSKPKHEQKVLEDFMNDINNRANKNTNKGELMDLNDMLDQARSLSSYYDLIPDGEDGIVPGDAVLSED